METNGLTLEAFQKGADDFDRELLKEGRENYQRFLSVAKSSNIPPEFWQVYLPRENYFLSLTMAILGTVGNSGTNDSHSHAVESLLGYPLEKRLTSFYLVHYASAISMVKNAYWAEEGLGSLTIPLGDKLQAIQKIESSLESGELKDPVMIALTKEVVSSTQKIKNLAGERALTIMKIKEAAYKEIGMVCKIEKAITQSLSHKESSTEPLDLGKLAKSMEYLPSPEQFQEAVALLEKHFSDPLNVQRVKNLLPTQ